MKTEPFVDLRAQHGRLAPEIERAVRAVFERVDFILGEATAWFEAEFAAFIGAACRGGRHRARRHRVRAARHLRRDDIPFRAAS